MNPCTKRLYLLLLCLCLPSVAHARQLLTSSVVDLSTVINFRDMGGKPTARGGCVRTGLLFRSASFGATTAADATELIRRVGLQVYYDLRSTWEIDRFGGPDTLLHAGVRWQRMPIDLPDDPIFREQERGPRQWSAFYLRMIHNRGGQFVRLLEDFARDATPAVFGCSLGKDRTGVAAALLLAALGVADDHVVADYVATTAALGHHTAAFAGWWQAYGGRGEQFIRSDTTAYPQTMRLFLAGVRQEHGSLLAALQTMGLTDETLQLLQQRFVHPAPCAP